ncbi:type IV secretory system conjugative DNA transfer family protein [Brevundimonas sp. FT23042]|uniref:type IV secretory system conjugative DNA transfer family protein n=1 Tax=Brevundimonas sp. FT23042 TaxID=3393749 RepID=UPI003B58AEA5
MIRFANASPASRATILLTAVVCGLVLAGVLTAIIALAGVGRLNSNIDPMKAPAWFWYYRDDPTLRRWLAVGAGVSGLLILGLVVAVLAHQRRPLHGAARWASAAEQRRAGLRGRAGVLLGRQGTDVIVAEGPGHVMLYAPTRTGKGVGVVIPNLLTWPGSVVVLDIKRENWLATAGFRKEAGQEVHLFDPLDREGRTARFNPLGHIDRSDPVSALDELQRIALMLFPLQPQTDPFWAEAARTGFIGVGAYVAATPSHPFTLGEIFRQLTQGDPRGRFPKLIDARRRAGSPLPLACVVALTDFCASSENTFASIRQSITTRMGLWLNPLADDATARSDFDLRDLRAGRISLYLGASPDNMGRVAPLYSLLFQQLVDLNARSLPSEADQPVLVLLDEFARLGPAPMLAQAFSWVAGYGLRLLPVIQSPSQLRALYGPDLTEDILTNCAIELVFAPKELRVAQELSDRLGYYTYAGRSLSRPRGLGRGAPRISLSDQRRALMLPQELMQLPDNALIVLKAGLSPVRGRKIVYYRERAFLRRLRRAPTLPLQTVIHMDAAIAPQTVSPEDLQFDALARAFTVEGLAPPPHDAPEAEVADWLDRVLEAPIAESELDLTS